MGGHSTSTRSYTPQMHHHPLVLAVTAPYYHMSGSLLALAECYFPAAGQSEPEAHQVTRPAHQAGVDLTTTCAERCRWPATLQPRQWPGMHHLATLWAPIYHHS